MNDDERSEKEFFNIKAESLLAQGLYQAAQDLALNWLDRFPGDPDSRSILCQAWTRMGKLDKVKQLLAEVDDEILNMSLIYARMGDLCRRSGLNQEASGFYQKFIDLNPQAAITREVEEKLASLQSSGELREEQEGCQQPVPALQTVTMAELYLKQGHREAAAEILEGIVGRTQNNERAQALLREIRGGGAGREEKKTPHSSGVIIGELDRWLHNIKRMRAHAA